ncbi:hypothetical protein FB566_2210 [Stackebrandtia endophytica]|uniref:Uncharacterized protein n=1 Tax=Stackebrandtia endophytica TaxID=1496996 RepID=A0A543AVS1_9ACTN|nr:hypothetical protein [Stackebrandtia endophytica]TQL76675.1 hypothetical protein FB566_2210 [Stackebrandtia endophytica]
MEGGTVTVIDFEGNPVGADLSDYERLPTSDRDAYQADLYGPDTATESAVLSDGTEVEWIVDGCVGEANRVLFPDGMFDFLEQRTHATGGADDGWLDDHRVREVHGRWSECMAQQGYLDFDIPWDAVTAMSSRQPSPEEGPEAQEAFAELNVAQAVADLACHERYDVQAVQEEVFWEYTMDYLTDYEVAVVAFADTAESVLETAQRIIQAGRLPA